MTAHDLTLVAGDSGAASCACGTPMGPGTPLEVFEKWQTHVGTVDLLDLLATAAKDEADARARVEQAVRDLVGLGVSARVIADASGHRLSVTVVQRIARAEHVQTPRRRRR